LTGFVPILALLGRDWYIFSPPFLEKQQAPQTSFGWGEGVMGEHGAEPEPEVRVRRGGSPIKKSSRFAHFTGSQYN